MDFGKPKKITYRDGKNPIQKKMRNEERGVRNGELPCEIPNS
jgi:hypothetical protein